MKNNFEEEHPQFKLNLNYDEDESIKQLREEILRKEQIRTVNRKILNLKEDLNKENKNVSLKIINIQEVINKKQIRVSNNIKILKANPDRFKSEFIQANTLIKEKEKENKLKIPEETNIIREKKLKYNENNILNNKLAFNDVDGIIAGSNFE